MYIFNVQTDVNNNIKKCTIDALSFMHQMQHVSRPIDKQNVGIKFARFSTKNPALFLTRKTWHKTILYLI